MVIYDSKGKIIKSSLGPRNEKKAKELIDEYNSLSVGDSLYTSTNLGRYLDSYFREHGLSYEQDFMCPPYREGEIVKMSNKVVSSRQIKFAKSEEDFQDAITELEMYFEVNAEGNMFPLGRRVNDWDYMYAVDDICRKYNVRFVDGFEMGRINPSYEGYGDHTYFVINSSKQIKSDYEDEKYSQGYEDALSNKRPAMPDDKDYMNGYNDGKDSRNKPNPPDDYEPGSVDITASRQIKSSYGPKKITTESKEEFYNEIKNLGYDIIDDDGKWLTLEKFPNVYEAEYTRYSDGNYELMLYNICKTGNKLESSRQIKSVYTRPDSERFDKYGYFNPYTPTADELLKTDEIKKVLSEELSKAYEPDPMDNYAGYDSTNERIGAIIEEVAKQFNVDTDYVDELAGEVQKTEYARSMAEWEWIYEHCDDKDKFWDWQNSEDMSLEDLGIDKEQMDKEVDEIVRKYVNSSRSIKSSRKLIKSSYEESFTVYPWDPNQVTGTSDEDLGLSYVVEVYGNEFVNVDEDTLNDIKDTLVQYFDDEAYVRDWNINYPNDQIEDAFDIVDPETMEVDDLARYFDYEAYGRDIRLNKRMIWDSEEECWVSAADINDEDLDDSKYIWIGSSKQQIRSERASQTVDKHSAEDLRIYAENNEEVYERFITPVVKNLRRKVKKGIYDEDKALIAWQNVIDEATKIYDKEQGSGKGFLTMFNKATRNEAAKGLMERMSDDVFQEE